MNVLNSQQQGFSSNFIAGLILADEKTPAEEFEKDRKKDKGKQESDLDEALEETFPASDPASPTRTDKPTGPKD